MATPEIVKRFHESNQIVGVWINKAVTKDEGPDLWKTLKQNGVDMLCTDHPLEVIKTLQEPWEKSSGHYDYLNILYTY